MRAIAVFFGGLLTISAIMLIAGPLVEPIAAVVLDSSAVQTLGWASEVKSIRTTLLQWVPAIFLAYLVTWAGMWVFRRGRTTGVRRQ